MKPLRIEFPAMPSIRKPMEEMIEKAREEDRTVVANINDIDVFANPDSTVDILMEYYKKIRELIDFMEDNDFDPNRFLTEEPNM